MAAAHRRGAERTARSPTSERASERGSPGGVEAQAPSPPRVAPAPWRRRPRGIRSGSGRREIADAAAGERGGGRRGSPGGTGREHRRFLAAPGPVGSRGCRVEAKRRPGRVGVHPPGRTPGAPPPRPRPPKQLFTTESGRRFGASRAETFLSLNGPFWRILLCSAWARVQQLLTDASPRARIRLPSVSWLGSRRVL